MITLVRDPTQRYLSAFFKQHSSCRVESKGGSKGGGEGGSGGSNEGGGRGGGDGNDEGQCISLLRQRVAELRASPRRKLMAHTLTGFLAGCTSSRGSSKDAPWCDEDDPTAALERVKEVLEGAGGSRGIGGMGGMGSMPLLGVATDPRFMAEVAKVLNVNVSELPAAGFREPWYNKLVDDERSGECSASGEGGSRKELESVFAFDHSLFEWILERGRERAEHTHPETLTSQQDAQYDGA